MEDEFVADQFRCSIVEVGTFQPDRIRHNGRCFSLIEIASTEHSESRQYHRNTFNMHRHTEDNGVEVFAEHADEGRVRGLEVVAETRFLF